jgi:hypothetical protein
LAILATSYEISVTKLSLTGPTESFKVDHSKITLRLVRTRFTYVSA